VTSKNAKFRPQLLDLTPSEFTGRPLDDLSGKGKPPTRRLSGFASSVFGSGKNDQLSPGRSSNRGPSRNRALTTSMGSANHAGAIRKSALEQHQSNRHIGKLWAALVVVAGAAVWATDVWKITANSGNPLAATSVIPKGIVGKPVFPSPDFFFADKTDALALSEPHSGTPVKPQKPEGPMAQQASFTSEAIQEEALHQESQDTITPTSQASLPSKIIQLNARPLKPQNAHLKGSDTGPIRPDTEKAAIIVAPPPSIAENERVITVASGNTFTGILSANGVSTNQLSPLFTDPIVREHLSTLKLGQTINLILAGDGSLNKLTTRVAPDRRVTIELIDGTYETSTVELPVIAERTVTTGLIEQSLYLAAEKANLQQSTIMALAEIFQWELDFARDIRAGDRFSLVYDRLYREGKYIGDGDILAAQFSRAGKTHTAIGFTNSEGETGYYTPEGESMRRTFMRHPVDVVRITSKFDPNRLHPVLHQIRAHRGVDYGSPYGSPIYATADGRVAFSGSKNAYGNTVILKHGEKFSTLYAHMSKISKKARVGKNVSQGDVIGYVGNSGRVTGTHLHYEFRVNDRQIDPLKVKLPAAEPIEDHYFASLEKRSEQMIALINATDQVAKASE